VNDTLDNAYEQAAEQLNRVGGNHAELPNEASIFLLVYSAQGVLDNGGYRYFFESNWPNHPPYSKFIDAYRETGCEKQADDFARVVASFPFENPHVNDSTRNRFINDNLDEDESEVKGWGDALCGDEEVWSKLEQFYLQNEGVFIKPSPLGSAQHQPGVFSPPLLTASWIMFCGGFAINAAPGGSVEYWAGNAMLFLSAAIASKSTKRVMALIGCTICLLFAYFDYENGLERKKHIEQQREETHQQNHSTLKPEAPMAEVA